MCIYYKLYSNLTAYYVAALFNKFYIYYGFLIINSNTVELNTSISLIEIAIVFVFVPIKSESLSIKPY